MRRILLDWTIVNDHPSALSFVAPDTKLLIPWTIHGYFAEHLGAKSRASHLILSAALKAETFEYIAVPEIEFKLPRASLSAQRNQDLLRTVLGYVEYLHDGYPRDDIRFASDLPAQLHSAEALGVPTLTGSELEEMLRVGGKQVPEVLKEIKRAPHVTRSLVLGTIGNVLVGVAVSLLSRVVFHNFAQIVRTMHVWGTIATIPALSIVLFWFRANHRLAYGLSEFGVGLVAAIHVFWPTFDYTALKPVVLLQLSGGLYIMVRGLENIGRGFAGGPIGEQWKRAFPP